MLQSMRCFFYRCWSCVETGDGTLQWVQREPDDMKRWEEDQTGLKQVTPLL